MSLQSILILYGSQTGNAQDTAELIEQEARRRHYPTRLLPADAYLHHITQLPTETAFILVVSTTGQGEPPHNISGLWKFLRRKSLGADSLCRVSMAVFGLGDSGYPKYNIMAKLMYRRLLSLGAQAMCPLGLGDDQHPSGHEAALDEWLPALWKGVGRVLPLPGMQEPVLDSTFSELPAAKYSVTFIDDCAAGPLSSAQGSSTHTTAIAAASAIEALDSVVVGLQLPPADTQQYTGSTPWLSRLTTNTRITAPTHFQDVRLIELDLTGSGIRFDPGDVLAMWPRQRETAVHAFMHRCGLKPGTRVSITSTTTATGSVDAPATTHSISPVMLRIEDLVSGVLDIDGAPPRRSFFQMLSRFTSSDLERERLAYFASPQGRDDLHEYNRREGRTVLEVLLDFPSADPPLEWLLQCVPRLQPRRFSIASSLQQHPNAAQLLVAIVEWTTPNRRTRKGVCTRWLKGLVPGEGAAVVPLWVERGALHLPPAPSTPLIMVGPGTGVAPFRSFIQERMAMVEGLGRDRGRGEGVGLNSQQDDDQEQQGEQLGAAASNGGSEGVVAPSLLFFGCRSQSGDYYCKEEWQAASACSVLGGPEGGIITAFSRDQSTKVYVTHKIREQGRAVWGFLQAGAAVYVAGSADKMPADVAAAIRDVMMQFGGLQSEEADAMIKKMESTKRWQVEAW